MLPLYIFLTAITAQFFYVLVNWYFLRRSEYLYYSVYVLTLLAYFLNKYLADENGIHHLVFFSLPKLYADKILCILSYIFYFKFGRHFVDTRNRYPSVDRLMILTENVLFTYIGIDIVLLCVAGNSPLENILFPPVNISIFIVLIFVFKAMLKKNEVLDRFILIGSMFYGISAFVTLWLGTNKNPLDEGHMAPLQIGAMVEMVFLNAGLVYKSRMLQQQIVSSQKELIEKYEENQELSLRLGNIRGRISRDLHDDMGATLSSIKAYSEILKTDSENLVIANLIRNNSSEMIESLELIAWSTNPAHDRIGSLKNMMRKFAVPLCHAKDIEFTMEKNTLNDDIQIPGETRQNLFMIFKEAINNMIKYAAATTCIIKMSVMDNRFTVTISDNGKGFDGTIKGTGNGLLNMHKRAEEINGTLLIENGPGKGSILRVSIAYPFRIPNSWDIK